MADLWRCLSEEAKHEIEKIKLEKLNKVEEVNNLSDLLEETKVKLAKVNKELCEYNKEEAKWNNTAVLVSDHAILRYLQRVKGLDVIEVIEEMLQNDSVKAECNKYNHHRGLVDVKGQYFLAVEKGKVLTVLNPEYADKWIK